MYQGLQICGCIESLCLQHFLYSINSSRVKLSTYTTKLHISDNESLSVLMKTAALLLATGIFFDVTLLNITLIPQRTITLKLNTKRRLKPKLLPRRLKPSQNKLDACLPKFQLLYPSVLLPAVLILVAPTTPRLSIALTRTSILPSVQSNLLTWQNTVAPMFSAGHTTSVDISVRFIAWKPRKRKLMHGLGKERERSLESSRVEYLNKLSTNFNIIVQCTWL